MKLTNTACLNAKPAEKPYKCFDGRGLYLEVMPNGHKLWRLKYRYVGKESRISLGTYPETSLAEARDKCGNVRKQLAAGINPAEARQAEKLQRHINAENTFEAITLRWHKHNKDRWSKRHGESILHRLQADIIPALGKLPIKNISAPQILSAIRKIEDRGAHEIARRSMQYCGQVFRYSVHEGLITSDPTRDLKGGLKPFKKGHYNALGIKDLPQFLRDLERNTPRLYPQTIRATRLLLLTFVRTSELLGARWDEFDFEKRSWNIPAERMKMRRPHIVPLSDQAIALLKEQKELTGRWQWVFPNQVRPQKSMSNGTILGAIRRLGYKEKTTGHGFRATAMSAIKEVLGYRHEVIDRQLAHARRNRVDAAYDRAEFLSDRTKMMQEWADYLDACSTGSNVVSADFGQKRA